MPLIEVEVVVKTTYAHKTVERQPIPASVRPVAQTVIEEIITGARWTPGAPGEVYDSFSPRDPDEAV